MFKHLDNNTPKSRNNRSAIFLSAFLHFLIILGVLYASTQSKVGVKEKLEPVVDFMDINKPTPPPPPPPEEIHREEPVEVKHEKPEERLENPVPKPPVRGFQALEAPNSVPSEIPKVDTTQHAVKPTDFSGEGQEGGTRTGVTSGGQPTDITKHDSGGLASSNEVFDMNVVDERPELKNGMEMQRVLTRLYPPLLREAGVTGTTVLEFVIDTGGNVEPGSIKVLESTNNDFSDASRLAGLRLKFKPAKANGHAVRVLTHMPILWKVSY